MQWEAELNSWSLSSRPMYLDWLTYWPPQLQVSFFFLYQPCSVWLLPNKESFSQPLALWFWLLHDLALSLIKFCASLGSRSRFAKSYSYCTLALSSQVHSHFRRVKCFKTKRTKCTNTLNIFSSIIPWSYSQEIEVLFYMIFLWSKAIIWRLPMISFEIWICR